MWGGKWCVLSIKGHRTEIRETWAAVLWKGLVWGDRKTLPVFSWLPSCCKLRSAVLLPLLLFITFIFWEHHSVLTPPACHLPQPGMTLQCQHPLNPLSVYLFKVLRSIWTLMFCWGFWQRRRAVMREYPVGAPRHLFKHFYPVGQQNPNPSHPPGPLILSTGQPPSTTSR